MEGTHEEMSPERLRKPRQSVFVSSLMGKTSGNGPLSFAGLTELGEEEEGETSEVDEDEYDKEQVESEVESKDSSEIFETNEETQMDKKARRASVQPLEDQLTNEKLKQLEEIFETADEDGGGGLDMEEFRNAMRTQLGTGITDAELDRIFMKVDTNCDGTVDWDEYLTYMLLECRGQDTMSVQARQPFPRYVQTIRTPHRDSIVRILLCGNRYMTVSQEGIVCFWSLNLRLLSSHRVEAPGKSVWVTDAVHLPTLPALLVATTSRDLIVFDISGKRFARTCLITNMNACALTMEYWSAGSEVMLLADGRRVRALVVLGDSRGGLSLIFFHAEPHTSPLNQRNEQTKKRARIAFQELLLNKHPGISAVYRPQVHGDFIHQVMYCHALGCTISCCRDTDTAMYVGGLAQKTKHSYFKVTKGIDTFDFCRTLNVIVTGGYDGVVRVWNPYVAKKPVIRLLGHQFPVLHVLVNQSREHVVSISENKEIRVHDLTTQTCIQTVFKKVIIGLGPRRVSAALLNQRRQSLVFATNTLALLEHRTEEGRSTALVSHAKPVAVAIFNPLFEQVVSVATDSLVCVWEVKTGEKVMQFQAHRVRRQGEMRDVEVTAMTFDPTFRRLITAAKNGVVRVWNFNNGAMLRELPRSDYQEVTTVLCARQQILTAGWDRRISVYVDQADDETMRLLKEYHRDDILSMDHYNNSILASSCHDGNILVWSLTTGRLLFCLNATKSHKQIRTASYIKAGLSDHKRGDEGEGAEDLETENPTSTFAELDEETGEVEDNEEVGSKERGGKSNEIFGNESDEDTEEKEDERNESCDKQEDGEGNWASNADKKESVSMEKLLFLQSRENDEGTATLLASCADGTIQAWSLHHHSGLLGVFPAAQGDNCSVLTMDTDEDNTILVTGDGRGYVKVFDISNYCLKGSEEREKDADFCAERDRWHAEFPFVAWLRVYRRYGLPDSWIMNYLKEEDTRPPVINSYRAHMESVSSVSLVYVCGRALLLSSSSDCSIRLWTIKGQLVGIFGQKDLWDTSLIRPVGRRYPAPVPPPAAAGEKTGIYRNRKVLLPPDIRRSGSPTTLTVINCGHRPAWCLCRNIFMWLFKNRRIPRHVTSLTTMEEQEQLEKAPEEQLDHAEQVKHQPTVGIMRAKFKRTTRHHPLPKITQPKFNGAGQALSVYGCLKFHGLEPIQHISPPESVREIQKRTIKSRFIKEALNVRKKSRIVRALRPLLKPEQISIGALGIKSPNSAGSSVNVRHTSSTSPSSPQAEDGVHIGREGSAVSINTSHSSIPSLENKKKLLFSISES